MNQIIAIFSLTTIAFLWAWFWSPILLKILQRFKCYKKTARTIAPDNQPTPIFNSLHQHKELCVPRMAGVLIWGTTLFLAIVFFYLSQIWPRTFLADFNFLSRSQTWITCLPHSMSCAALTV
jgi:UDP-N-acetylmuramyl pentapeptide phosphotransferase/UDP-N-acetylglucosamine-1-phosphate transferase